MQLIKAMLGSAHLDEGQRRSEQHFGAFNHDAVPDASCGLCRQGCGEHAAEPLPSEPPQAALQPVENLHQARVLAVHQHIKHALLYIQA